MACTFTISPDQIAVNAQETSKLSVGYNRSCVPGMVSANDVQRVNFNSRRLREQIHRDHNAAGIPITDQDAFQAFE